VDRLVGWIDADVNRLQCHSELRKGKRGYLMYTVMR